MKTYPYLILFLILAGCSNSGRPKDVLAPKKMVPIVRDLYEAELKSQMAHATTDSMRVVYKYYQQKVFDKYDINDSLFQRSFLYYMNSPEELSGIYDGILDSLNLLSQHLEYGR